MMKTKVLSIGGIMVRMEKLYTHKGMTGSEVCPMDKLWLL